MATQDRFPTGNSATAARNEFTSGTGGNKWDDVDEAVADDATSYVSSVNTSQTQQFTYTAFSTGSTSINKVTLTFRAQRTAAGGCSMGGRIRIVATNHTGINQALTTTWTTYTVDYLTNPATAAAWVNDADLNTIVEFGVASAGMNAGEEAQCTQCYLTVDYTAGGGTTYTLTADGGTFALTGQAATLRAGRKVTADAGSYALTGTAATLRAARRLSADGGSYTLTGTAASLVYNPNTGAYTLVAESGALTLTGTAAALRAARRMTAAAGGFALTGQTATLRASRRLAASAGAIVWTGNAAALRASRVLSALGGAFVITGTDTDLIWSGEDVALSDIALTGSYVPVLVLTGSYAPTLTATGSYAPSIHLTGSVE